MDARKKETLNLFWNEFIFPYFDSMLRCKKNMPGKYKI